MSQRHAAATKSCVFTRRGHVAGNCSWDTCSSDIVTLRTHKHVPYAWTTHDSVAATCVCDTSLRHNPSCARTFKDRKQRGFEIRINVRCQVVSENEKPESTPLHTVTTKSSAREIAIEVMNDQTKVPNEFLLRSVVRFTALIDM